MKLIELTQGKQAQVDDEDYERVRCIKWYASKTGKRFYAGNDKHRTMHRFILGPIPDGLVVDHIDGNGLNNQRSNLRVVTHAQNCAHRPMLNTNNRSGFTGVYWKKSIRRWVAQKRVAGKLKIIRHCKTKDEAIKARRDFDAQ